MRQIVFPILTVLVQSTYGQSPIPPLDPLPKEFLPGVGYWENGGQVADVNEVPMNEVRFYSEGVVPKTCFMNGGHLGLVREVLSPDTILPDTLYRVDLIPVDASDVEPIGIDASMDYMNFYFGYTMPSGVENMHRYRYVAYPNLWPGITMWVYADGHKQRIAFACAPGSDPSVIKFRYAGQEDAALDSEGNALLDLGYGDMIMSAPMIYKVVGNTTVVLAEEGPATIEEVNGGDAVEYTVPEVETDPAKPTVLLFSEEMPEVERGGGVSGVCWSTYYGGNRLDYISESAKDRYNNYYVTGWTRSNPQTFPTGIGGPIVYSPGSYYGTLSQFNDEERLIWTSMIGGGLNTLTYPMAMAVRDATSPTIYIGGHASGPAPNLYTVLPVGSSAYFDNTPTPNSINGFICRFNEIGGLQWSTYWGGRTTIFGMAISDRRLLVTGGTYDPLPIPVVAPPLGATSWPAQPTITTTADAYVCAFNHIDQTHWLCYLGGSAGESGYDVRCEGANIYVYGQTQSPDFPTVPLPGAFNDNSFGGPPMVDAFLVRFNSNFTNLWSTYFGGSNWDEAAWNGLAISPLNGDVYIVGTVRMPQGSSGFPLQPHANGLAYFDGVVDPGNNGFIAHFNGSTSALVWCTYFGNYDWFHFMEAVTVDKWGMVYVAGETASPNMPVLSSTNYTYFQPAIEPNEGQDNDAFLAMFKPVDDVMNWCTYFGGNAGIIPERIRTLVAKEGALFAGGFTSKFNNLSSYFPLQDNGIPGSFYDDIFGDLVNPTQDVFLTKFCTPWSNLVDGDEKSRTPEEGFNAHGFMCWLVDGILNIPGVGEGCIARCIAVDGRLVLEQRLFSTSVSSIQTLSVGHLNPGLYTLVLSSGQSGKFLIP